MNWKRIITVVSLVIAVLFFGVQIFLTLRESKVLAAKNADLSKRLEALTIEKNNISQDLEYYANPANLEKLLREKFNYKLPGEKMIIVIPNSNR